MFNLQAVPSTYAFGGQFQEAVSPSLAQEEGTWAALIDAAQIHQLAQRIGKRFEPSRVLALYQGTFAENALALSPLVLCLSHEPSQRQSEIDTLNELCQDAPILSIVHLTQPVSEWLAHLRSLLRLAMDGTPYLWRLADTLVLNATLAALTDEQRGQVLQGVQAWWLMSAEGRPINLLHEQAPASAPLMIKDTWALDATQTQELFAALAPSQLAAQLRAMAPDFHTSLSHMQQLQFARYCVEEARLECIDEDGELLDYAMAAWRTLGLAPQG